ncbi:MAG: hypothetical protein ABIP48_00360, partial [Planctomycetota bacterium]
GARGWGGGGGRRRGPPGARAWVGAAAGLRAEGAAGGGGGAKRRSKSLAWASAPGTSTRWDKRLPKPSKGSAARLAAERPARALTPG